MFKHSCVFVDVIYRLDVTLTCLHQFLKIMFGIQSVKISYQGEICLRILESHSASLGDLKSFCCRIKHLLPCFDVFYVRWQYFCQVSACGIPLLRSQIYPL